MKTGGKKATADETGAEYAFWSSAPMSVIGWLADLLGPPPLERVGRNRPCPCGSGRKFKRCCLDRRARGDREDAARRAAAATNYFGSAAELGDRALANAHAYRRPRVK